MDENFIHDIDLDRLQEETRLDIDGLARLCGLTNPKGVYKWAKGKDGYGTRPSYNALVRLIDAGATVETLFGVEYRGAVRVVEKPVQITDADIGAMLQRAAEALRNSAK